MAGNDLGSLLGGLLGGSRSGDRSSAGNILGALLGSLGGNGSKGAGTGAASTNGDNPLAGLMDMLNRSGLVEQAQSWIGTGENKPVTGAQITEALPDRTLQEVAQETGVSPQKAADEIAGSLPKAVDKLTPNGQLPQGGSLEELIRAQRL
ncbi:YidB family protein [Streptomyces sp. NPDC057445]|uniref:YidB family protein n=1 Tax=Streptomyces sp. NPDC057445 TaxID=3346136 RepID=UPI00367AF2AE